MEKISHSAEETKQIGHEIAATITSPPILSLHGDLGPGKTTLVQGIAEGLGIKEEITSPTFTLMNVYEITNYKLQITNLVHIDTYRLKNQQELIDIGAEDYLGQPGVVTIIEWPEKIEKLLQNKKIISITLEHLDADERRITIE